MQFSLIPFVPFAFGKCNDTPVINGSLTRSDKKLEVIFEPANYPDVDWPLVDPNPQRLDNLWQATCFECFLGLSDSTSYIEINASPAGHWQAYHFKTYRDERSICGDVAVEVQALPTKSIIINVDIDHPDFVTSPWEISPSVILFSKGGKQSFYAIQHPKQQPDFHWAQSRTLRLANS